MNYINFITSDLLMLVPFLYIIGICIKKSKINDKYIPVLILIICYFLIILLRDNYTMPNLLESFIQSTIITSTTVFSNQLIKQSKK